MVVVVEIVEVVVIDVVDEVVVVVVVVVSACDFLTVIITKSKKIHIILFLKIILKFISLFCYF